MNFPVILGAALIPTVIGFIWYHPKVLGTAWMNASGVTEDMIKASNMPLIFGVSLVLSVMLSAQVNMLVVHQGHIASLFVGHESPEAAAYVENFMAQYGTLHRTWSHGIVHGIIAGLFFVVPVLGTNALFERKGFKYIAVNSGYWIITLAIMGAVICMLP